MSKKRAWLRPPINDISLSIVTDPLPIGKYKITEAIKSQLRKGLNLIKNSFNPAPSYLLSKYRGHPAVTRSIVEGLQKIKILSNYNPTELNQLSQSVVVVSGISALKQMILLKQQGYIKCLIAGPNILNDVSSERDILSAPEIDRYITHAPVCSLIKRIVPALSSRCVAWASGVDCDYWTPDLTLKRDQILIYSKQNKGPTDSLDKYAQWLIAKGYEVSYVNYGSYSPEDYKNLLQKACLMIGFSRDESQGIAWAEAWACDVPTLFRKHNESVYLGVQYDGSVAPYLTEQTGRYFQDLNSFINIFEKWELNDFFFKPRQWCLDNMSDEVCSQNLLEILDTVKNPYLEFQ